MQIITRRHDGEIKSTITEMRDGAHSLHYVDLDEGRRVAGFGAYLPGSVRAKDVNGHAWLEIWHVSATGEETFTYVHLSCSPDELAATATKAAEVTA